MSHNIMMRNGKAAFFGTTAAWHKLGQVVVGSQTWLEAMKQADLDWTVSKLRFSSPVNGLPVDAWGIFRDDDAQLLGVVGGQYTPIQNAYAFNFVDSILQADGEAHYESAGALGNGERIWCLAKINGESDVTGTGDKHLHYLLFATSHDGSLSATCKLTTVRVVCNNTLTQALNLNGALTKIKHTRTAEDRLNASKNLITQAHVGIKEIEKKLIELSKRIVTKESFGDVMKKLFGDWTKKTDSSVRIENKIEQVTALYEQNDNNQFPSIRGTGYNLLNSITEWTDHVSGVRRTAARASLSDDQLRAENSLFGSGEKLKSEALEVILEATQGAERKSTTLYVDRPAPAINGSLKNVLDLVNI